MGAPFDATEALKRTTSRPADYQRQRRTVEKLLGMAKQITVAELCVKLDLPAAVQTQAGRMFDAYRERAQIDDQSDFTHPQYAAMSVYQCCKAMRTKVSRSTLLRHSHLRGAQWTILEHDWTKCMGPADGLLAAMQRLAAKTAPQQTAEAAVDEDDGMGAEAVAKQMAGKKDANVAAESYEDWRDRMLKMAYERLATERGHSS